MIARALLLTGAANEDCWRYIQENSARADDPDECRRLLPARRISYNKRGYPQLKVVKKPNDPEESHTTPNTKVLAYHLSALRNPDNNIKDFVVRVLRGGGYVGSVRHEISHCCNNKRCVNPTHMVAESCKINKSRNYCPVVVYINNVVRAHCHHVPPCIPNEEHRQKAFRYHV